MARYPAGRLGAEAMRGLTALGCVAIETPLTDAEFTRVERECGFTFADDHRAFLAAGLPVGDCWPNWREPNAERVVKQLARPVEGVLFDVENHVFWDSTWGARPSDIRVAVDVAREHLGRVPRMVPIYAHRCLPAGRGTFGHPVLSIHQTDVICYGADLVDYVLQDFGRSTNAGTADSRRRAHPTVDFWSALIE